MKKSNIMLGQLAVQFGIYVCLLVIIGLLAGCAHDIRTPEEREYDNQVYLETQFIPAVENCIRSGGTLVYDIKSTWRLNSSRQSRTAYGRAGPWYTTALTARESETSWIRKHGSDYTAQTPSTLHAWRNKHGT
jgi:hypothetical protein